MIARPFLRLFGALMLVACGCLLLPISTAAQSAGNQLTEAERNRLYEELYNEESDLARKQKVIKKVIKLVRPAVVHIEVDRSGGSGFSRGESEETGSGVILQIKRKSYVLTNRHLIKGASVRDITIRLADGREIAPSRTWADPGTDVAVMAINGSRLVHARTGDSNRTEMGDFVLAIGSPFGLAHSVTLGIISAKGRRDLELATDGVNYQDFMQTDASINPGNSGGPLVNLRGEVIGINTAIASSTGRNEGIGFTIPINMAMVVARQLIDHGSVVRGFLGVNLDARFTAAAAASLGLDRPRGARVTSITPDSPAARSDLQVGDVILRFDNTWIDDDDHLVNAVGLTAVGHQAKVLILREKQEMELHVEVGDRSKF